MPKRNLTRLIRPVLFLTYVRGYQGKIVALATICAMLSCGCFDSSRPAGVPLPHSLENKKKSSPIGAFLHLITRGKPLEMKDSMKEEMFPSLKSVSYLIFKRSETGRVVAHCLDLDLVASASTQEEAERRLDILVSGQIANAIATGNVLLLNHKAPQEYWEKLKLCQTLQNRVLKVELPNPIPACGEIGVVKAECAAIA